MASSKVAAATDSLRNPPLDATRASQKEHGHEFGIEIRNERKQKGETEEEVEKKEDIESDI